MNKLFLLSLLFVGSISATFAQSTIQTSIYFNSGKANLDQTDLNNLEDFVQKLNILGDYDLDIKAYTDDVGSIEYNKKLAARRANSIQEFLGTKELETTKTSVEGIGEIALLGDLTVKDERQQNRRVDIVATPFQPQSLEEFYSYFSKRNQTRYYINPNRDTIIEGAKGTMIFIPAQSFQLKGGGDVASSQVEIMLEEAYTYQDMLLANLGTISNGEMLETGGMIYLEGRTKDGQELEIKEGESLRITMPSEKPLAKDMQLFVADRPHGETAEEINWNATNEPFESSYDEDPPVFAFAETGLTNIDRIEPLALPTWRGKPEKLVKPTPPTEPRYRSEELLTEERIRELYKKRKGESDKAYETRIAEKVAKAPQKQQKNIEVNQRAKEKYEANIAAYEAALAKYNNDVLAQASYLEDLDSTRSYIFYNRGEVSSWLEKFNWAKGSLIGKMARVVKRTDRLEDYKDYLIQECVRLGLTEEAQRVRAIQFEEEARFLKKVVGRFARCGRTNTDLYKDKAAGYVKILNEHLKMQEPENLQIFGMNPKRRSVERLYNCVSSLEDSRNLFNRIIDNYNEVLETSNFYEKAKELDELCQVLKTVHDIVMTTKADRGILTKSQAKQAYMNSVGISKMGWINCDRFIRGGERMTLAVNFPQDVDVQFYAVFDNINGIMPLAYADGAYKVGQIPVTQPMRIIGIRAHKGKMEMFEQAGTAKDLNEISPTFESKSLKELRSNLAKL
ncbi:MAG: OmpA family protein [Saprospiraceae bacterium]|nr:OmpA family protein [Saprospiraceae bacterium]